MTEADAIALVDDPVTIEQLHEEFRSLGIAPGDTVLCHASLQSLGWVCGGAPAVVDALQSAITTSGTLVMPTHTTQYSDPEDWSDPPVPDAWVSTIRATRPPYRPAITPSRGMGAIAECFRQYPEVYRSPHPLYSFAVWGRDAQSIADTHEFDNPLGEDSPLGVVYNRDGQLLMLGTDYETNTSLHLGEYLAALDQERCNVTAPIRVNGEQRDVTYTEPVISSHDFADVGAAYEQRHDVRVGSVGAATARLLEQPSLVDFAADWFSANR